MNIQGPQPSSLLLTFRALPKSRFLCHFTQKAERTSRVQTPGTVRAKGTFLQPDQVYEVQKRHMNEKFSLKERDDLSLNPTSHTLGSILPQRAGFCLTSHRTLKEVTYSDTRGGKSSWILERKRKIRHLGQLNTKASRIYSQADW